MPHPTHLVYIVNDAKFFISHRLDHAIFFKNQGWKVSVICPIDDLVAIITKQGIHHITWDLTQTSTHPMRELKSFFNLKRLMKETHCDLFHSVTIKANLYSGMIIRLFSMKQPIIFAISGFGSTMEGNQAFRLSQLVIKLIYRWILKNPNSKVIVQNKEAKTIMSSLSEKKRCYLVKGVGVNINKVIDFKRKFYPEKPLRFAMISRLIAEKGVMEFLLAANQVLKKYPKSVFELWGFFYQKKSTLQFETIKPYLNDNIRFKGYCQDTLQTLKNIDVLVLPSYHEGFPKILIDASSCSCGIITTNVAGCTEVIKNRENGLIVEPRSVSEITKAMIELIENQKLLEKISINARRKAEKEFDVHQIAKRIFEIQSQSIKSITP